MIEPCFESTCFAWCPSLQKDLQKRLQLFQNNCVSFCLQLEKEKRMGATKFKGIDWLNLNGTFSF